MRGNRVSRRSRIIAVVLLAVVAGGCQSHYVADGGPPSGNAVALRVQEIGGGPGQAGHIDLPRFVLYGDGRLIVPDGTEGAVPLAREYHLTREAFNHLYERARSAGLGVPHAYDTPAPDAPVLLITLGVGQGQANTRIVAPDPHASGSAGDAVRAVEFDRADLSDRDLTEVPIRYTPSRVAVSSTYAESGARPGAPAWPLEPLDGGSAVNGGRCLAYSGPSLDRTLALGRAARPGALWTSGGATYQVFFRPLLPDESDCGVLGHIR
ncbi:MAG: hypothetical protein JOZ47_10690 [Kutzneria sp.]|nr:hypothetical protein [Kutzneria sp.]